MKPLHSKSRLQRLLVAARGAVATTPRRAANDVAPPNPGSSADAPYEWPAVLEESREPAFVHDAERRILRCNAAYAARAGLPMSDILGKPYWRVLPRLPAPPAPCGSEPCDDAIQFADAGRIFVSRGGIAHRPSGDFWYCRHLLVDVTAHVKLKRELEREKAISDAIIDSAPNLFFLVDKDAKLVRWNGYLRKKSGLSDEELRGRPAALLVHPDDRALATAKLLTALATGDARMEVRSAEDGPAPAFFLTTARRMAIDGAPYVAGFCFDISARKKAEKALAEQMAFLDALIENIPGVFCVLDKEGNCLRWNSNFNKVTGLGNEALLKRSALLSIADHHRAKAAQKLREAFEKGYVETVLDVVSQDRGTRAFLMTARRFHIEDTPYLISVGIDATEQLETIKALEQEARTDNLTQLPNRSHFIERAMHEFGRGRRYGHPLSIAMLDLDHFKNVNDRYGHQAGDAVLRAFVTAGRQALRDWDVMGRMGGEEFAVLLPETAPDQALLVAERLRQTVAATIVPLGDGATVAVTVSIGITAMAPDDRDVHAMLARADAALYAAKTTGRDKVQPG